MNNMNKLFALTFGVSSIMFATSVMATPNGNPNGTPPPFQDGGDSNASIEIGDTTVKNNPTFKNNPVLNNDPTFNNNPVNIPVGIGIGKGGEGGRGGRGGNGGDGGDATSFSKGGSAFSGAANLTKSQLEGILNSANASNSESSNANTATNTIEQGSSTGNVTQFSEENTTLVLPDPIQFSDTEFNVTPGIDGLGCGQYRPSIDYGGSNSTKVGAWVFGYERAEVADDVPDAVIDRHFTALVKGSGLCSGAYMLQNYVDPSPHVPVEVKQDLYEDFTNSLEQYFKDLSPAVVK